MSAAWVTLLVMLASAGAAAAPQEPTPTWTPPDRSAPEPPADPAAPPEPPPPPLPPPEPRAPPEAPSLQPPEGPARAAEQPQERPVLAPSEGAVPKPPEESPPGASPSPRAEAAARRRLSKRTYQLVAGVGPAATGAPQFVVGGGLRLFGTRAARIDASLLAGWSSHEEPTPVSAAWGTGSETFQSATWSVRTLLLELSGWWDAGPVVVRAGGGLHFSFIQLSADYTYRGCYDLFCTRTYDGADTDYDTGSTSAAALLSAGVHLPVGDRVLLGVDLRWLAPVTSTTSNFPVSSRLGGFGASLTSTLRLGP